MLMLKDDLQFYIFLPPLMRLFIKSKRHLPALSDQKSIDLLLQLNYKTASHQDKCTAALQAVITHEIITRVTFTQLCQQILWHMMMFSENVGAVDGGCAGLLLEPSGDRW